MTFKSEWRPDWGTFTKKLQDKMREAAYKSLFRGGYLIQGDARRLCPVNTGLLRSSITVEGNFSGLYVKIGTNLSYAAPVEFGSRPHTPPFAPIRDWAEKKGLPAGAIWQSIRQHGTKPHPYLKPALDKNIDKIKENLVASIAKAVK